MKKPKFSILIPTYNAALTIRETIGSIVHQNFSNYEIIVQDNNSQDNTLEVVRDCKNKRIRIFKNKSNVGAPQNLITAKKHAKGEIIFLMASDDLLAQGALSSTYNAFKLNPNIGAVSRPYFWFDKDPQIAVRAKKHLDSKKNEIVRIDDDFARLRTVLSTLDQLSGLAYRNKFMTKTFSKDLWTPHVFPFLWILKSHPVVFLKNYTIAVRIGSSATRKNIYKNSPMQSWIKLIETVFEEKRHNQIRRKIIADFISVNYIGLIQIASYGSFFSLIREIWYLIKYRPINLLSPAFWFFALLTMMTPAFVLRVITDWYKNSVSSRLLASRNYSTYKFVSPIGK